MFNFFKSKRYFLKKQRETLFETIANNEIDLGILEKLHPDTVVGQKPLSKSSSQDVKAGQLLEEVKTQYQNTLIKLEVINKLL